MVLMHDAPSAVDLTQTQGQSKFKRFPPALRIDASALPIAVAKVLPVGSGGSARIRKYRDLLRVDDPLRHTGHRAITGTLRFQQAQHWGWYLDDSLRLALPGCRRPPACLGSWTGYRLPDRICMR
jgi:hypothetical protein